MTAELVKKNGNGNSEPKNKTDINYELISRNNRKKKVVKEKKEKITRMEKIIEIKAMFEVFLPIIILLEISKEKKNYIENLIEAK